MAKQPKDVPRGRDELDGGEAFLPDPRRTPVPKVRDTLAEMVATEYLESATSAEEQGEDVRDQITPDELGGPFVEVSANEEFGEEPDVEEDEEPIDREPFPTAMRSTSR